MSNINIVPTPVPGDLITMLGGRLQFHPAEPLVIIDDLEVPFGPISVSVLQALAQPLGVYIDRNALYEKIWGEPHPSGLVNNSRLNKAILNTRKNLSAEFGTGTGRQILTSTASTPTSIIKYALYDPPHLHKRTRTYPQKIT